MSVDTIVNKAMSDIPKAVASGVVDMGTGMLLAVKTTESHPQAVLDLVSAGSKELFEGDQTMSIEQAFKQIRGDESRAHYFHEILINSENLIHYFARLKSAPNVVMTVVCRADANLGLVVAKARMIAQSETI